MKETTGELNATVVVVLAVSVLIAFFYYTIWPVIRTNFNQSANCSKAICDNCDTTTGYCDCYLESSPSNHFECVYKG